MLMVSKEQFLSSVWGKINNHSVIAIDAVIDTAEAAGLDMETAGKIVARDSKLKSLMETQARSMNNLK